MAEGLFLTDSMEEAVPLWDGRVNMCRDELCRASCLWAGRTSRDVPGNTVTQINGQEERFLQYRGQQMFPITALIQHLDFEGISHLVFPSSECFRECYAGSTLACKKKKKNIIQEHFRQPYSKDSVQRRTDIVLICRLSMCFWGNYMFICLAFIIVFQQQQLNLVCH